MLAPGGMLGVFLTLGLLPATAAQDEPWKPPVEVMGHRCLVEEMSWLDAAVATGDDLVDLQTSQGAALLRKGIVTKDGFDINLPAHRERWVDKAATSKGGNPLCPGYIWNFLAPPGKVMKFGADEKSAKFWPELKIIGPASRLLQSLMWVFP